jgi:1-carboxybiuret hydrolase subunit AtzG-like
MSTPDPLDDYIDAAARLLDLTLDPEWKPAVRAHLEVTLRLGTLVGDFGLPDEAEPAPVFVA